MSTAALQSPSHHAALIGALGGNEPEAALEKAFVQLQRGADLQLLLAMIKALVTAGVPGLAVRLLRSAGDSVSERADLAALAAQLSKLPTGEIPGEVLHHNLQAVRSALISSNRWLKPLVAQLDRLPHHVHVFRSRTRNHFVVRDDPDHRLRFVFAVTDEAKQADALALNDEQHSTSFLCLGVPTVAAWNRLLAVKSSLGHVPSIDLVETEPGILAIWLGLLNSTDCFSGERVAVFAGNTAVREYQSFLQNHPWRQSATHRLVSSRPGWTPPSLDDQFNATITRAVTERRASKKTALKSRYGGRDRAWCARRFAEAGRTQPPLRVIGLTTRYSTVLQHAMRDIAAAFRRRGCEFELVMQPNVHAVAVEVQQPLLEREADLVFVINHLRQEMAEVLPASIPYVCWIQDHMDLLCDPKMGRSITDLDLVISHSPLVLHNLYEYPADRLLYSSNLTDAAIYSSEPLPKVELDPYRCDVSYLGHGAGTPESLVDEIAARMGASLACYLSLFLRMASVELSERGWLVGSDIVRLMLKAERESGHPPLTPNARRSHVFPQLQRIYDRILRHQTLQWAANWATSRGRVFSIHGQGWEQHPTLFAFARGEVPSGRPLRALYQASAVSIQVNGYGSLHQRLLDGLASGGCMICRYNPLDFVRRPFSMLKDVIEQRQLTSLEALVRVAECDPSLRSVIDKAELFGGACLEPVTSARRQAHIAMLKAGNPISDLYTDEGLFQGLADGRFVGETSAADLPGFGQCCFNTEAELHRLLDELVDNRDQRQAISQPMREDVVRLHTFDGLVERVLNTFSRAVAEIGK